MTNRWRLLLAFSILATACSQKDPVVTHPPDVAPMIEVVKDRFLLEYTRESGMRLAIWFDKEGRTISKELVAELRHAAPESPSINGWQLRVTPIGKGLARLDWAGMTGIPVRLGNSPLVRKAPVVSQPVRVGDIVYLAWMENAPGLQRLMLTSLNLRNGIANTQILKDGLAADCAPAIGVVDNNLLVAYVRRGRIRSQLIRLPTSS